MKKVISEKTYWITGASSGIGEALALEMAAKGGSLILSARNQDALARVREQCEQRGATQAVVVPMDLSDQASMDTAWKQVQAKGLLPDVLVHNGGISQRGLVEETDYQVYDRIFKVNILGYIYLTKLVLPYFIERQSGQFVVVSSLVGKFSTPYRSGYSSTKHALHGFFDALRAETYRHGLRVTIVCPGYIQTNVTVNALAADGSKHGKMGKSQAEGMPAPVFASKMLRAIEKQKREVYIGGKEVMGVYISRWLPGIFHLVMRNYKVS